MKVSIAIPSLNYARYLEVCLESIRTQTYRDFEVLIADGGSTDGSLAIIERYCMEDPRFRLVSRSDEGQADAVRRALAHASGDVFAFLNADDLYLSKTALEDVVERLPRDGRPMVLSLGGWFVDAAGRCLRKVRTRYHPLDGPHLMKYRTAVLQPATFWTRAVAERVPLDTRFHFVFDVVFFYNAWRQFPWQESDLAVAGYRWHGANKSGPVSAARIRELAAFEHIKFGDGHWRGSYLSCVATLVAKCERNAVGRIFNKLLKIVVNGLSFLSVYRVPGI